MRFKKIQLINAAVSEPYKNFTRTSCYPPLGLVALASFIKNKIPGVVVEIIDNDLYSLDEIFKMIDSPLVGINSSILSFPNVIKIAMEAKRKGAIVIIGGPYASSFPVEILKNRQFVDLIALGNSEDIVFKLIIGEDFSKIPGLVYRGGNREILVNPPTEFNSYSPILDFDLIPNLDIYFKNYEKRFKGNIGHSRSLPIYSYKGCPHKDENGGCIFCWLQTNFVSLKTPQQFWSEISYYSKRYKVNLFWDVSNCFTWDKEWLRKLVVEKPKGFDIYFYIFAQLNDLDIEIVRLLEKLKCAEVFIGFESNANELISKTNKKTNEKINSNAINLFKNTDIIVYPSFILGLPGETEKTIEKTIRFASKLKKNLKIYEITCSILTPLPGSAVWNSLLQKTRRPDLYLSKDIFDWTEIKKDWVENFCHVSYDYLEGAVNRLLNLVDIDNRIEFANVNKNNRIEFKNE